MTAAVASHTVFPPHITGARIDEFAAYEQGIPLANRYRKLADIQAGSYGRVSVALDTSTQRQVAIKAMDKRVAGVTAVARHEVSILKRLGRHENICALLDCHETRTHYFLVFEHCAHGDLYDYLQRPENHLNPSRRNGSPLMFNQFVKELVAAVNYAHSKGVYHRDIKPENILIDAHGTVKLTDWGLATVCGKCFDPCIGTEKYMAPETFFHQSSNPKSMTSYDSAKADYWSVGVTMLYVLFGKCPFKLANVSDADFSSFVQSSTFLTHKYPTMTVHGHNVVMQVLQLNPHHRSLEACLDVLMKNYTTPLTTEQSVEVDAVQFSDEIFSFDDEDSSADEPFAFSTINTTTTTATSAPSAYIEHHSTAKVMPIPSPRHTQMDVPPSLVESTANSIMGQSWADLDDWDVESFQLCLPSSVKERGMAKEVQGARQSYRAEQAWY